MDLFIGKEFETADDAVKFVNEFAKTGFHPLRQRHSKTVQVYNKMVSANNRLPMELKYQSIHWECKHHGTYKPSGQGKRKVVHTFAKECPVEITITYNRMIGKFVAKHVNIIHENHEISENLFQLYHDQRRPTGRLADEADHMLQVNENPTLVAKMLHSEGYKVRVKDLYNRKQHLTRTVLTRDIEQMHKHFDTSVKATVISSGNSSLQQYYKEYTTSCADLVREEMAKLDKESYSIIAGVNDYLISHDDMMYTVSRSPKWSCSCSMPATLGIPCQHIFCVLRNLQEDLYQPDLVADRWKLQYNNPIGHGSSQVVCVPDQQNTCNMTRSARFTSAMVVTKDVCSYIADQPATDFPKYNTCLQLFRQQLFAGEVDRVLRLLQPSDTRSASDTREPVNDSTVTATTVLADVKPYALPMEVVSLH